MRKKSLIFSLRRVIMSLVSHGDVAQLGEHQVRNLGVESSILFVSTIDDSIRRSRTVSPFFVCMAIDRDKEKQIKTGLAPSDFSGDASPVSIAQCS